MSREADEMAMRIARVVVFNLGITKQEAAIAVFDYAASFKPMCEEIVAAVNASGEAVKARDEIAKTSAKKLKKLRKQVKAMEKSSQPQPFPGFFHSPHSVSQNGHRQHAI